MGVTLPTLVVLLGAALAVVVLVSLFLAYRAAARGVEPRPPTRQTGPRVPAPVRLVLGGLIMALSLAGIVMTSTMSGGVGALWAVLQGAMFGAMGLQLAADAKGGQWRKTAVRVGGAVVVAASFLAGLNLGVGFGGRIATSLVSGAIAAAIVDPAARWWLRVLERDDPQAVRPGYLLGGGLWALFSALGAVAWLTMLAHSEYSRVLGGISWYLYRSSLFPAFIVISMLVLYAGLPRTPGDARAHRWRRRLLIATFVLGSVGLLDALLFAAFTGTWEARLTGIGASVLVWAGAMLWVRSVWWAAAREAPPE